MTAKLDGQFYNIVRVSKKITGGFPVTTAQCEHITYLLNEEQYNLVTFVFEGTPADGMVQLLSGTLFFCWRNRSDRARGMRLHRPKPSQPPQRAHALY